MTLDSPSKVVSNSTDSNHSVQVKYGTNMRITVAANQGGRKYMEDRVHIETFRDESGSILYTYLGVYDGHGGAEASEFVRRNLMNNILSSELFDSEKDDEILEAIRQGFLTTHHHMLKVVDQWPRTASGYASTAGTTSSVAIIRNGKVYSGHVGDSAIIIGRNTSRDGSFLQLIPDRITVDHKPESVEEQVMMKSGVSRVVWTRPLRGHTGPVRRSTPTENIPFLAVARSLGDLWSFCEATQTFIVSPEPDVAVRVLTDMDKCLVLASDGLTNVLTPSQVTAIVQEEERLLGANGECDDALHRPKHTNHSRLLLATSLKNWRSFRADNISAITVMFDSPFAELWDDEACVEERLRDDQSIDEAFSLDPECMIRVSPEGTQKLATYRTPLVYEGALDANFCSVDYRGPGFMTHDEEDELENRFLKSKQIDNQEPEQELNLPDILEEVNQPSPTNVTKTISSVDVTLSTTPVLSKKEDDSDEEEPTISPAGSADKDVSNDNVLKSSSLTSDRRITRSSHSVGLTPSASTCTPRRVAVAVRKSALRNKASPRGSMIKAMSNDKTTFVQISVNEMETESAGMVTRSRDRQTTVVVGVINRTGASPDMCCTPSNSVSTNDELKSSRKRGRRISPSRAGITPFVNRLSLDSPASPFLIRSAPSTPAKPEESPFNNRWSLSKLEGVKNITMNSHDEPPSKIRRIYGFVRRLFGQQ